MFLFFLVNNNKTPSDAKYDFRGQPHFSCLIFFFSCWAFNRLHFGGKEFLGKLLGS